MRNSSVKKINLVKKTKRKVNSIVKRSKRKVNSIVKRSKRKVTARGKKSSDMKPFIYLTPIQKQNYIDKSLNSRRKSNFKLKQQMLNLPEKMRKIKDEIVKLAEDSPTPTQSRIGRYEMGPNEAAIIQSYHDFVKDELKELVNIAKTKTNIEDYTELEIILDDVKSLKNMITDQLNEAIRLDNEQIDNEQQII